MVPREADRKKRERRALDFLLTRLDVGIEIENVVERESPDFEVHGRYGTVIGVEVVEVVESSVAAGMAGFERLRAELQRAMDEAGLRLAVMLQTGGGFIPKLNEGGVAASHAAGLLVLLRQHEAEGRGPCTYLRRELRGHGVEWIMRAIVSPAEAPAVGRIARRSGIGLMPVVPQLVQEKEAKLDGYRAAIGGPVWLLLVAGTQFAAGVWSETLRHRALRSSFDRLFYVDAYDSAAFEVERDDGSAR